MVKVFDKVSDFEAYVLGGMVAGDLYYVKEDDSVHFRTNNIDGSDKEYSMSAEGSSAVLIEGEFTANGTYEPEEADGYSSVVVNVAGGSEPELVWETLVGNNLEMNLGTTYVFKTNVAGVYMWHLGIDTSGDGTIDNIDDESQSPLGQMVAGTEYYFTALKEAAGYDNNTHSYMIFAGSSFTIETALPAGAVIQYAVKPEPSEDSDSEDDSPVEPSNDSPVVGE